jgi:hypothetical protein
MMASPSKLTEVGQPNYLFLYTGQSWQDEKFVDLVMLFHQILNGSQTEEKLWSMKTLNYYRII